MPPIYTWKIGLSGAEVTFLPLNPGVEIEIKKYGRYNPSKVPPALPVDKRRFKIDFAHMRQAQRDLLYAEFSRYSVLKLHDNVGNIYNVYWGDCDRSLNGTAHQPDKPEFGIDRSNMIGGALRYSGSAILSEV